MQCGLIHFDVECADVALFYADDLQLFGFEVAQVNGALVSFVPGPRPR